MASPDAPRHFSMIRSFHLADFLTIANGALGVLAIFHAMKHLVTGDRGQLYLGAALVPAAIVFDVLDGHVARWRHQASVLGRELDSLADVISFGVAPAALAYAAGARGVLDQIALVYFATCGLSRLARYNVTAAQLTGESGKVRYYEGTPITFALVPLGILMWAFRAGALGVVAGGHFHLVSLAFLVSGTLMISKTLRIPKP